MRKIFSIFLIAFFAIAIFLFFEREDDLMRVVFFDVGQGDSALIQTPFGQDILIDGGPDNSVLERLGYELGVFNRDIELLIISHPHEDHLTGLVEIIRRYDVDKILYTGADHQSEVYEEFLNEIKKQDKIDLLIVNKEQSISLGDNALLEILYPNEDISEMVINDLNNTSMVLKLVFGENSFLFMGDAESEIEEKIDKDKIKDIDVLKVSHHGSKTNDKRFLEAVGPEYAVISVGEDNIFLHPSQNTLNILDNLGSEILRTDIYGDIVFRSDGQRIEFTP
ncbi:MBL fold metallo-hydrolase [Candidatus Parcubacteria bacterium]|nr:MAG: MBL fold metallo-hydrolase [Candidatus Parcubacteria bacterium]